MSDQGKVATGVLASVISAGLAGVIAWNWQRHSFDQSADNREFLQKQLIESLEASAKASQEVASHIARSTDVLDDIATQMDDVSDETRALNRWVETFVRRTDEIEYAQEALQDEVHELPRYIETESLPAEGPE